MADNMCGPSNAAKRFTQHLDQARPSQDVRLHSANTAASTPNQAFRQATYGVGYDHAGRQFSTFHRSSAPLSVNPHHQTLGPDPMPMPYLHDNSGPSLHVASPNPHTRGFATPSQGTSWANEFRPMTFKDYEIKAYQEQAKRDAEMAQARKLHHRHRDYPHPPLHGVHRFDPEEYALLAAMHTRSPSTRATISRETVDQDRMAREFDAELEAWMSNFHIQVPDQLTAENLAAHSKQEAKSRNNQASSDQATAVKDTSEKSQKTGDTELAKAAQLIIDSVAENQTDKFKNSDFIKMMRKIADQDLVVRNNALVQADQTSIMTDSGIGSGTASTRDFKSTPKRPVVSIEDVMEE
ncbi:hypothetical protein F5Y04DRAFT_244055 [Hypomontagnella monticulosa]|nr:hypothetical protein F5Y04DRAFT_244055 [Hypomontagnella monticulosa]